ncbi:SDR family oxidoreductase [Amycolatopsis ultiminotia]|uniref:SDR family oxidoreductase n=1 Tax=Amycolatopsis ultiminotia TaxID=543629 RepID=A0ABP6V7C1_9PSEU
MDLHLNGKVALVLGAGGGLGGAIAEGLADEGASVGLADINGDALTGVQERIGTRAATTAVKWDLGELDRIESNLAAVTEQLGPIDVLVNLTGGPPPTPVAGQQTAEWERHFRSMVLSVIAITDAVLPGMRERGWGRIITCASSGVVAPIPNLGLSNALRSSLLGWSKTLAREIGRDGVTTNVVVPGRIGTGRIVALDQAKADREGRTAEEVSAESVAGIPVGRYGDPREFADVVTFLASQRAGYLTGSVVRVDGGLIASV